MESRPTFALLAMSPPDTQAVADSPLTLPHGDAIAGELIAAVTGVI
jgi:hypothetical protein